MLSSDQTTNLKVVLHKAGLELIDNKKAILIEKIKNAVLDRLNNSDVIIKTNFSTYLSKKLDLDILTWPIYFQNTRDRP
ncbi:hypothetical protein [Mucilaginibacter sp. UYCu711]|uniref:hypothetical protein n=1 Tax=Mucilaginibacter sp. UYCu711 TaxID=3156339 RepID=UPI003D1DFF53